MATTSFLPSFSLQSHSFLFEPPMTKTERLYTDDHVSDPDISNWLKLEDPMPSVCSNSTNSTLFNQSSENNEFTLPFQVPVNSYQQQSQFPFPAQYQLTFPPSINNSVGYSSDLQFDFLAQQNNNNNNNNTNNTTNNPLFSLPPSLEFAQSMTPPQLYQLFAQFQQILKSQSEDIQFATPSNAIPYPENNSEKKKSNEQQTICSSC